MDTETLSFLQKSGSCGWYFVEQLRCVPHKDAECLIEFGQEAIYIAEDAQTYDQLFRLHLRDHASAGNRFHAFFNQALLAASLTLQESLTYSRSLPIIKERAVLDTKIHAALSCMRRTLDRSKPAIYGSAEARDQLRLARSQLSRSFKHLMNNAAPSHNGNSFLKIQVSKSVGETVDAIHILHRETPFSIGGPQLDMADLPYVVQQHLNSFHTPERLHWMKISLTETGQNWISELSKVAPTRFLKLMQAELVRRFWTTTFEQVRDVAGQGTQPEFHEFETLLRRIVTQTDPPTVRVAVIGAVKSGKSTFVNSVVGQDILPSSNQAATAWPCRIRHKPGLKCPILSYNSAHFNEALSAIRSARIGPHLAQNMPSSNDFGVKAWINLPRPTQENLKLFYGSWTLDQEATGTEAIRQMLSDMNDIYRICKRFGLDFDDSGVDWPVIDTEFQSLRDTGPEIIEFIDVPGIGEDMLLSSFLPIVIKVIAQCEVVIPIVNGTELDTKLWREIPDLVRLAGLRRRVDLVVCTHLDCLSQVHQELERDIEARKKIISLAFGITKEQVIPCTPSHGLGAQLLLRKSSVEVKPIVEFTNGIAELDVSTIRDICGSERAFHRSTPAEFLEDLKEFHKRSGMVYLLGILRHVVLRNLYEKQLSYDTFEIYQEVSFLALFQEQYIRIMELGKSTVKKLVADFLSEKQASSVKLRGWEEKESVCVDVALGRLERHLHNLCSSKPAGIIAKIAQEQCRLWSDRMSLKVGLGRTRYVFKGTGEETTANAELFAIELTQRILREVREIFRAVFFHHYSITYQARISDIDSVVSNAGVPGHFSELQDVFMMDKIPRGYDLQKPASFLRDEYRPWEHFVNKLSLSSNSVPWILRVILKRKTSVVIDVEDCLQRFETELHALICEILPLCKKDLERVVTAASSSGRAKFKRVLSDRERLLQTVAASAKPGGHDELAAMVVVFANLTTTKAALQKLLTYIRDL